MKKLIPLAIFSFFIWACSTPDKNNGSESDPEGENHMHEGHHHHETDTNKANIHMNENDFQHLVDRFEDPARDAWQEPDKVIAMMGDLEGKNIADIGAGTGYFSFRLADKGAHVIAVDVDKRFQKYIEDKIQETNEENIETRLAEYDDPKLAKDETDAILIVNTYHHFNDRVDYMKKCKAGLNEKGKLYIVDYMKKESENGPPLDHRMSYNVVLPELKQAGFNNIEIDSLSLSEQYIITATRANLH